MHVLQEIFSNREIAIGFWSIVAFIIFIFKKPFRKSLKNIIKILFCRKFVTFYIVFITFFLVVIYGLHYMEIWEVNLLKDTIFWVFFVELPIFIKAIEKAEDFYFFDMLLKENIKLIVIVEFFLDFWTFNLWFELLFIPIIVVISILYVISAQKKEFISIKKTCEVIFGVIGLMSIIYAIYHTVTEPYQIFNLNSLKTLLLPIVLLFLNLPVVYGLALYNVYEQVFVHLKGNKKEKCKMRFRIFIFAGINLYKITAIRKNISEIIITSLTEKELHSNLNKLKKSLSFRIGDNYMKRVNFYIIACIVVFIASSIGIILLNTDASLKDIIKFNFTLNILNLKEIITYILATIVVLSVFMFIFAIGLRKRKNEEISQVKKFALFELLTSVKRQCNQLQEYIPIEEPSSLFNLYVINACEIKLACDMILYKYENLLKTWEKESIERLQLYATRVIGNIGIKAEELNKYNAVSFIEYYNNKVSMSVQNEKINVFKSTLKLDIEKYCEKIKFFVEEFKMYF